MLRPSSETKSSRPPPTGCHRAPPTTRSPANSPAAMHPATTPHVYPHGNDAGRGRWFPPTNCRRPFPPTKSAAPPSCRRIVWSWIIFAVAAGSTPRRACRPRNYPRRPAQCTAPRRPKDRRRCTVHEKFRRAETTVPDRLSPARAVRLCSPPSN